MQKNAPILALLLAALAGCAGQPKAPPVVYNSADVIASGKPPLLFSISRPGALTVIDVTTQSRIFHADARPDYGTMRLDAETRELAYENTAATQPADRWLKNLPIDPNHIYAVEFLPDYKATPPATQPGK